MTLDEMRASKAATVNATDIADVLGCSAQFLRIMAREHPEQLGFPCCVIRKRVRFPRGAFLRFLSGGEPAWDNSWEVQ